MSYLCAVQSVCLSSRSACFTFGTDEFIAIQFCVDNLLQALCCRLSDAAVGEVHLLVELYELSTAACKKRNCTWPCLYSSLRWQTYLLFSVTLQLIRSVTDSTLREHESEWVMHNVKWCVTNARGSDLSQRVIFDSGNKHTRLVSSCCISAVAPKSGATSLTEVFTSHTGDPDLILGRSTWDFWWTEWHWDWFSGILVLSVTVIAPILHTHLLTCHPHSIILAAEKIVNQHT